MLLSVFYGAIVTLYLGMLDTGLLDYSCSVIVPSITIEFSCLCFSLLVFLPCLNVPYL